VRDDALTGKERHLHFRILCLQGNCQVDAIHAGEKHVYDCELRTPFFGFQQRESRLGGLNRTSLISLVRKYDGENLCDDILIVN